MHVSVAHIRERTHFAGWLSCCVFDARATSGTHAANTPLLATLIAASKAANLLVDHASPSRLRCRPIAILRQSQPHPSPVQEGLPSWTPTLTV